MNDTVISTKGMRTFGVDSGYLSSDNKRLLNAIHVVGIVPNLH